MGMHSDEPASVRRYNETVTRLQSEPGDEDSIRFRELAALVELALGAPPPPPMIQALADNQAKFIQDQQRLAAEAAAGAMPREAYSRAVARLMQETMAANYRVLGPKLFDEIFGEAGHAPEGMIEPDIEGQISGGSLSR